MLRGAYGPRRSSVDSDIGLSPPAYTGRGEVRAGAGDSCEYGDSDELNCPVTRYAGCGERRRGPADAPVGPASPSPAALARSLSLDEERVAPPYCATPYSGTVRLGTNSQEKRVSQASYDR